MPFLSEELKDFLLKKGGGVTSRITYYPKGNSHVGRFNGIIWKTVILALKQETLMYIRVELFFQISIPSHSISYRSLMCAFANCTPHERTSSILEGSRQPEDCLLGSSMEVRSS